MDGGRRRFWDGGPGGGACRKDDALVSGWKAVPPLVLLVRLALGGDNETESFGRVQLCCGVCKDVRKAHVILWGRRGRLWQVHVCPSLEPDARFLVRAKRKWRRNDSGGISR